MTQEMPERPGPMPCPFPPCGANLRPLIHRTDPYDKSKIATVYPIHNVEGDASWFGRCPASQFAVPHLSFRALEFLAETTASYERRLAERIKLAAMLEAVNRSHDEVDERTDANGPAGRAQRLPTDDYFPGRPADGPEPGRGDEPAAPVPAGVGATPLGKEAMNSSRAETKAMLAAAAQAGTEIQSGVTVVTEELDMIDAALAGIADNQQIAGAMMVAAIGTDGDAPEEAVSALGSASRVGELLNEMRDAVALLRMKSEGMDRVAGRIHRGATEYSDSF